MAGSELKELIIYSTLVFMMAPVSLLLYIYIYNNRKKKHIEEKRQLKTAFDQELLKAQIEIQEQTLTYISREIHDNINQVLSFVKLNLSVNNSTTESQKQVKIDESRNLVAQVINDLRDLSKSLSFEHISQLGLLKTVEIEVDRIHKSGIISIGLKVEGQPHELGAQLELMLFRIFQEAVNNALKHGGAKQISIRLQYRDDFFRLTIEDDGTGFDVNSLETGGSGLRNMQNRVTLIGAAMEIDSVPGKGCRINITIDQLTQPTYAN